jgi:triosephosphate isomerase
MNRKYRKTVIAGNWKMNTTPSQARVFLEELKKDLPGNRTCDVILCPPYPLIPGIVEYAKECRVSVGAQNVSQFVSGAHTGEVSLAMLEDLGVQYVILGHSERRADNGETDFLVNAKARYTLAIDMRPIICVGESKEERERDLTMERIGYQVKAALWGIEPTDMKKVILAYEPVWAIGTGKTATAEQAQEVCEAIRAILRGLYGARVARGVSILYGGSMNAKNARELLAMPDIDGGLIGGASLSPVDFSEIIAATDQD